MNGELTREELIAEATDAAGCTMAEVVGVHADDLTDEDELLSALETLYGDGYADETTGAYEAPTEFVYRIGKWTVQCGDQQKVVEHADEPAAKAHMERVSAEFGKWVKAGNE